MKTYDAIVVGGRCAGAATALLLARAGHRVLVLERSQLPADTVSTHALLLGGVLQLHRWGVLDDVIATGAPAVDGVDICAGDVAFTARVKPTAGVTALYAARRYLLDEVLLDAAVDAGAEVRTGYRVTGLLRNPAGGLTCVRAEQAGRSEMFDARVVIGADGVGSTVAGLVNAPLLRYDAPQSACHYAYFADLPAQRYEFCFGQRAAAGAIPTNDGLTCVYAMCPTEDLPALRRDIPGGFAAIVGRAAPNLAERLRDAKQQNSFRGTRGLPGFLRQSWGPGWVLVGDAAWHRDPISAHGMTDAFRDAELAALAIGRHLGGERNALADYQTVRDSFAVPVYEQTRLLASYDWDTDGVLGILGRFGDAADAEIDYLRELDLAVAR